MGSAISRLLLDCCPAGVSGFLLSGWRTGSGRWGASRDSCSSSAAFASAAGAPCGLDAAAAAVDLDKFDDFVPLKAQHRAKQMTEPRARATESAGLVAAAENQQQSHFKQQQQQQQYSHYGSTNPVAMATENELGDARVHRHIISSSSSGQPRSGQPQTQQPILNAAERQELEHEMQQQQEELQELQRLKLESEFTNRGLGQVHFMLHYLIAKSALYIRIVKGTNLIAQDSNGLSDPYVKVHLLPDTGKGTKLRTRTCPRTLNPVWDEEFCYSGVLPSDLEKRNIRLTLLDEDTIGYDWLGEVVLPLKQLSHGRKEFYTVFLQPRNEELERSLTSQAGDRGKILIGLYYAPAKNELTVKVIQCVNLLAMDPNGYSDPFVKLFLKPDRNRGEKFKTEVKKKTLNPEFKEDFVFSVSPQELPMKTLEVTVWDKDFGTKNDFIGALMLGNKCSGDRLTHWEALLKQPYQAHTQWHPLGVELQH